MMLAPFAGESVLFASFHYLDVAACQQAFSGGGCVRE